MEMSTLRGASADDHRSSPVPDDCKTTISIPTSEEPVATRKCCTLCNLLVRFVFYRSILEEIFSVFQLASDLHLQTHLRGTRHNQLLLERFHPKKPSQEELVNNLNFLFR